MEHVVTTTTGAVGLAWLIPVLPLLGFVAILALRSTLREKTAWIAIGAAWASFALSVAIWIQLIGDGATHIRPMFTWISAGNFTVTFDLLVDHLTVVMLLVVTGVGSLIHVYSLGYMHGDERYERFFAYLNLFLFSMLMLVLGSNFLGLFLGWELVGLSSYLLIGFWFENREYASAAKKAFITNRVGDVSFMIGMFLIFNLFGSLNFLDVLPHAGQLSSGYALAIVLLLLGGATAKSAQIPLYVWLPDAMAGPTPVSALIHAATMVTAGVYLFARTSPLVVQSLSGMQIIAWIGVMTALLAALIAIRQDDIKKILAYSTVSQLGYMFVGVGSGAFSSGVFHLVTHAFFKGLLFLAAGSVMHAMANRTDIWKMGGLRKIMPVTFWTAGAAWLAISGLPPFAGFFSKDQILSSAYDHGMFWVWLIGVITAALTAFYMSRWFFLIFLGKPRWQVGEAVSDPHASPPPASDDTGPTPSSQDAHVTHLHPHESPWSMTGPLVVLGILSTIGGFVLNWTHEGPFFHWLTPAVASSEGVGFAEGGALGEPALITISIVAALVGIAAAWFAYMRKPIEAGQISEPVRGRFAELMERKFFVDELYEAIFVTFGGWVADALAWFDRTVIDGVVNGAGAVSTFTARYTRRVQTGLVRGYVASLVLGAVVLVAVLLFQVR